MPLRGEEFGGRTVEEAIERGLHQLGRRRSDVDIEILERGKPANMLGMGGEDARVLLTFDEVLQDEEPAIDEVDVAGTAAPPALEDAEGIAPLGPDELNVAENVLRELLEKMGIQADVEERGSEGLEVLGPELGLLIGRGGENLVALQQITSAITSRRVGRTVHVPVDVEGYRRRREDQLREVARRVAGRVRASGQAMTLEPMLAYERRIVHLAVQDQPGIRTESVGIEPNRRVVISSAAPSARAPGGVVPSARATGPGAPPRPDPARPRAAPTGYGPRRGYGPRPGGMRTRPDDPAPASGSERPGDAERADDSPRLGDPARPDDPPRPSDPGDGR